MSREMANSVWRIIYEFEKYHVTETLPLTGIDWADEWSLHKVFRSFFPLMNF